MRSSLGSRKATWIWDKVSGKEAWLVTRVGEGIKGVTSMNIGDVADFDSTVSSLGDGKWVSEPLGVLDIDSVTGVVVAKRTGHARIKFMAGDESAFVRQVLVGKSEGIALDRELVLSSGQGEKMVGVVLGSGDSNLLAEKKVGTVPPPGDLFSCDIAWDKGVEISEVFSVQEVWAEVRLTVFGVVNSVKYLPAITVHHTSLEVGVAGGVIRVAGHSAVLDLLDTRHSEGIVLGSPWLEEG